jgi:aryl-alcohol dehydrogenase-like predicted oxidoreductase
MERRTLGRTDIRLPVLGFGCGAVGGLMVKGTAAEQERAIARALELGVDYFDTAPLYGNGASETNLGRALKALRPRSCFVSTKLTLVPADHGRIAEAVADSLDASLRRLGLERVDLLQLHNRIASEGDDRPLAAEIVLGEVAPALARLREQGKIRFAGITALGDTPLLHRVVASGAFDTAQIVYNLLNPSAGGGSAPPGAQDFAGLLGAAQTAGMGTIGIRVLAGGALSGTLERHPYAMQTVPPIASGPDYRADVERAHRFDALIRDGHAGSLVEVALRFAIASPAMTTVLVGTATLEQFEYAAACVDKGPLPQDVLERAGGLSR